MFIALTNNNNSNITEDYDASKCTYPLEFEANRHYNIHQYKNMKNNDTTNENMDDDFLFEKKSTTW